jgi:hypothetical protein
MPIITRAQGIGFGLARYFTGKPCKRGHIAERHCPGGNCVKCAQMWSDLTVKNGRGRYRTAWSRAYHRKRAGMPEPSRPDPGKCEICDLPCSSGKALALDHDHATGKFRGWLCGSCNLGLGKFSDSIIMLQKAIDYIGKNSAG